VSQRPRPGGAGGKGGRRPPPRKRPVPRARQTRPTGFIVGVAVVIVIGIAALVAVVASGSGGGKDNTSSKKSGGAATTAGTIEYGKVTVDGRPLPQFDENQPAKGDGAALPTITGQSPTGTPVTVQPGGGPQVVIVGAPWCPHCNRELPKTVKALNDGSLGHPRITLVVTAQQPSYPNWPPAEWVASTLHWPTNLAPVMLDDKDTTAASALGTPAYPYFVFVDSQGKVGSRLTGEIGIDVFKQHLDALR
jgi:hypothetical protein